VRLAVAGIAPGLPAGGSARLELFARLADGSDVSLGARQVEIGVGGAFRATLAPFIPPCRVLAAIGQQASPALGVTGAPTLCDAKLLMQVSRARVSCDGRMLRVSGRRAPPMGTVLGSDGAAGTTLFSVAARPNGAFEAQVDVTTAPRSLRAEALAGGHRWALDALVPVTRDRCGDDGEAATATRRED
jgi:hypothetical protein